MTRLGAARTRGSGGRIRTSSGKWGEAPRQRSVLSPALADVGGRCSAAFASSAVTRARTASRAASGILMPATSTTARASNSMRSAEIASHFASQSGETCTFPERNASCSSPVLPTRCRLGPVLITGVIPEEPALTQAVAVDGLPGRHRHDQRGPRLTMKTHLRWSFSPGASSCFCNSPTTAGFVLTWPPDRPLQ